MEERVIVLACSGETVEKQPGLKGEAMPFEALIAKLSPTLKRITCKLDGHFTFMDDQDLFQEALIHLWSDIQLGKLDDKTDSYISKVVSSISRTVSGRARIRQLCSA